MPDTKSKNRPITIYNTQSFDLPKIGPWIYKCSSYRWTNSASAVNSAREWHVRQIYVDERPELLHLSTIRSFRFTSRSREETRPRIVYLRLPVGNSRKESAQLLMFLFVMIKYLDGGFIVSGAGYNCLCLVSGGKRAGFVSWKWVKSNIFVLVSFRSQPLYIQITERYDTFLRHKSIIMILKEKTERN